MDDQERIYDLIFNSNGLTKAEIKKAANLTEDDVKRYLDSLYRFGLIDREGGKYRAVADEKVSELYLERNVDLDFLKESVDKSLVDELWSKYSLNEPLGIKEKTSKESKAASVSGLEGKISQLERKMRVLEKLQKSLEEIKKIK